MLRINSATDLIDISVTNQSNTAVFLAPMSSQNIVVKTYTDKLAALASIHNNRLVGGMGYDVPTQSLLILKPEGFPQRLKEIYGGSPKLYALNMNYLSGQSLPQYLQNATLEERKFCGQFVFNDLIPAIVGGIGNLDFNPTNLIIEKDKSKTARTYEDYVLNTCFKPFDFETITLGREHETALTGLTEPLPLVEMYQGQKTPEKNIQKAIIDLRQLFTEDEMKVCTVIMEASLRKRMNLIRDNQTSLTESGLGQKSDTVLKRLKTLYDHHSKG